MGEHAIDPLLAVAAGLVAWLATLVAARTRPRWLTTRGGRATAVVVALSALGGAAAPGAPTGLPGLDVVLRATAAGLLAGAGTRSRRSAWLVAAALVAAARPTAGWDVAAFGGLGLAAGAGAVERRGRLVGAAVGALVAQAALRLGWSPVPGASAAVAAVAGAVLLGSWLSVGTPVTRRRARVIGATACAALVLASALAATAAVAARPPLTHGVRAAEAGLASVRSGHLDAAAADLARAGRQLGVARGHLGGWWTRPARPVPLVGRYVRSGEDLAAAGADLAAAAGAALEAAEEVRFDAGQLDPVALATLSARLASLATAADRASGALEDARDLWLPAGVVADLDGLAGRLLAARRDAARGAAAARVAAAMLGNERPRRYLVAALSIAEQRALGGIVGAFGEVTVADGRVRLTRSGQIDEVAAALRGSEAPAEPMLALDPAYRRYAGSTPDRFPQNVTLVPDFPTAARTLAGLYQRATGRAVDGVIGVDPVAVAALLRLTGPVDVAPWPEPIGPGNAEEVLLHEQYVALEGAVRDAFLDRVMAAVLDHLGGADLPPPADLGRVLHQPLAGGHVMVHSVVPDEQAVLEDLGVAGAMPPTRGGDFLQITTQQSVASKIDWFARRELTYRPTYDPATGELRAVAELRLTNLAPAGGLPPYVIGGADGQGPHPPGHSQLVVSVYTPLELLAGTVQGRPVNFERTHELGRNVFSRAVVVPPGGTVAVRVELAGAVDPGTYQLTVRSQPLVEPEQRTVEVRPAPGWRPAGTHRVATKGPGDTDVEVTFEPAP